MNCISRNCLLLVVLTCLFPFFVFAEIPAGYYDDAVGKSGEDLQKSLSTILNDATDVEVIMACGIFIKRQIDVPMGKCGTCIPM